MVHGIVISLQYFKALSMGRKRVDEARAYLNEISGDRAMPALAVSNPQGNSWEPVGSENLYAFVDDSPGFVLTDDSGSILAIVDKNGFSKAVVQGVTHTQREAIEARLVDDGIQVYRGKVTLPV